MSRVAPGVVKRIRKRLSFSTSVLIGFAVVGSWPAQTSAAEPACHCANCAAGDKSSVESTRVDGAWLLRNTDNFCVCCPSGMDPAAFGQSCESLRQELTKKWLGDAASEQSWSSRCYVVVHPTLASYLREVGQGGNRTLGSSLIKTDAGRVTSRRIDLRGDVADPLRAALPHEMTHVILADAFAGEHLPRWADEGMAMQADPRDKLRLHSRDLNAAVVEQSLFRVPELFAEADYPAGDRRAVFYAESVSLVSCLASRRAPAEFVSFIHRAGKQGYDAALRDIYGIHDVGELEHLWRSRTELAVR
jgi:hypothetical protein